MPNHMSDLGFIMETDAEIQALAFRALQEGETVEAVKGSYIKWAPGEGIELWLQLDSHSDVVGFNPHFSGSSVMKVCLTERRVRSEEGSLDGGFRAWANLENETEETGACPFMFDVPDYQLIEISDLPAFATIQVAAFAHELESFENDEAYEESQTGEFKMASESFIPAGLFSSGGGAEEPPFAEAVFSGHILETSLITNPVTGVEFCWVRTSTPIGEVDVVAAPALLNGPLIQRGVLSGSFWLSARLVPKSS
jgi:hypothetical protein